QAQMFRPLPVLDVESSHIPSIDLSLLIEERIVASQKPTVLAVPVADPLLKLERHGSRKRLLALANHLQILGVNNAMPIVLLYNVIESEAGVIQDRPIGVQDRSIRAQYMDESRDYVRYQRQLFLR